MTSHELTSLETTSHFTTDATQANVMSSSSEHCGASNSTTTCGPGTIPSRTEEGTSGDVSQAGSGHNYWTLALLVFPALTVFGNALVVLSIYRERSLRSVTNYFIFSLAIADIMVAILVMPLAIYVEVKDGVWELGDALCDTFVALDVMCCTASILNLAAISVDRFIAVTQPIQYAKHKNSRRVYVMLALTWVISLAISSPIALGMNYTPRRKPTLCTFYNAAFLIYSSMGSFYIPCIVMVLLYWRIFHAIRLHARRAAAQKNHPRPLACRVSLGASTAGERGEDRDPDPAVAPSDADCRSELLPKGPPPAVIGGGARGAGSESRAVEFIEEEVNEGDVAANFDGWGDGQLSAVGARQTGISGSGEQQVLCMRDDLEDTESAIPPEARTSNLELDSSHVGRMEELARTGSLVEGAGYLSPVGGQAAPESMAGSMAASSTMNSVLTCSSTADCAAANSSELLALGTEPTTSEFHRLQASEFALKLPQRETGNYVDQACGISAKGGKVLPPKRPVSLTNDACFSRGYQLSTVDSRAPGSQYTNLTAASSSSPSSPGNLTLLPSNTASLATEILTSSLLHVKPVTSQRVAAYGEVTSGPLAVKPNERRRCRNGRTAAAGRDALAKQTGSIRMQFRFRAKEGRERPVSDRTTQSAHRRERKATKTLAIVLGVFLLCWVPFFTINIFNAICIRYDLFHMTAACTIDPILFSFLVWLGYMNSFLNPVIYTIFNVEFRRAFSRILHAPCN